MRGSVTVDPEARKRPAALLEALEHGACPLELAERDERLDVERLAAIGDHVPGPDRVEALAHPRQRLVDGAVVAGRELDEAERGEQERLPPRAPGRSASSISGSSVVRARSVLPRPASTIARKRNAIVHGPGRSTLGDRGAALLDEALRLVPPPRPELDEGEVRLPLGPPVVLAALAVPLVLDRVTSSRAASKSSIEWKWMQREDASAALPAPLCASSSRHRSSSLGFAPSPEQELGPEPVEDDARPGPRRPAPGRAASMAASASSTARVGSWAAW